MTETPNQTQIEPSAEAVLAASMDMFNVSGETYERATKDALERATKDALVVAYAIDLAPIIAERNKLSKMYSDLELHFEAITAHADRLAAERDRMKAALEAILDYRFLDEFLDGKKHDFDVWAIRKSDLKRARAALEPKP